MACAEEIVVREMVYVWWENWEAGCYILFAFFEIGIARYLILCYKDADRISGGEFMQSIYCPAKDKEVYVMRTQLNAETLENPNETVSGRMKCSDDDYLCDYDNCPLRKKAE